MPQYSVPVEQRGEDPIVEAAKQFMKSPQWSRQFMANAEQAMEAPNMGMAGEQDLLAGMSTPDLLAGVLTAEGGSAQDQQYILDVINNRVNSPSYPNDVRGVLLQPGQFSALNGVTGYAGGSGANDLWRNPTGVSSGLADDFVNGLFQPGATGGALNYYQPELAQPDWGGAGFRPLPGSTHVFGSA